MLGNCLTIFEVLIPPHSTKVGDAMDGLGLVDMMITGSTFFKAHIL